MRYIARDSAKADRLWEELCRKEGKPRANIDERGTVSLRCSECKATTDIAPVFSDTKSYAAT